MPQVVAWGPDVAQLMRGAGRPITICVDDFGLHDGVNQAVFDLVTLGRISATSVLVDGPAWVAGAATLRERTGHAANPATRRADVGLHLNFTEALDEGVRCHPVGALGQVIRATYLRQWDVARVQAEVARQWDRFVAVWGAPPDFVDGHQHVHQLPQIREALAAVLAARVGASVERPWLRQCRSLGWRGLRAGLGVGDTAKAAVIEALGASSAGAMAQRLGLRACSHLLGVYPFDANEPAFLHRWRAWLQAAGANDVVMCHPATPPQNSLALPDVIAASRHMEHRVLTGPAFGDLLAQTGRQVSRLGYTA